ncbi:MFS transporter [Nocardioides sp. ChNu-99]|uniref:MFS transporter n=1 Tax=Nocardioides sp. ChNu-99 TaxID=2839897 RepID=UPI0024061F7D|nr:MFS transporter [Nocardioides sp. ChNu-99]MDF9716129.1 MFS transporter [Nocardioides sp. ChNu-99]
MLPHRRELQTYPTGARRRRLLAVVILALFISAYEGQLAPVLPLLLDDLGMSLRLYGLLTAASLLFGALAGFVGGSLADRFGRVRLLVPFMFLSGLACLFMATSQSITQFALARILLAFVEGVAVAGTAPLVRDFTPRLGRAQAYAFWSWGPVGANFFAAGVAAATLDLLGGTWQSQLYLMAAVSLAGSVVIALTLQDLAPHLRREVRFSDDSARAARAPLARPGARHLVGHAVVWQHVIAMSSLFVLLGTMNAYGQVLVVDTFGVSVRTASLVVVFFWAANLVTSLAVARWSDTVQRRSPFLLGGGVGILLALSALLLLMGRGEAASPAAVVGVLVVLGAAMGGVFGPWMASFSAHTEEIHPDLQGSAFGLQHLVSRLLVLASVVLAPRVAEAAGWRTWLLVALVLAGVFTVLAGWLHRAERRLLRRPTQATGADVLTRTGGAGATATG